VLDLIFRPKYAKNRYIGAVRAMRIGDLFGDSDGDGDGDALGVGFWSGFYAGVRHQHAVHTT
jgi:hypothetical protein